MEVVKVLWFVCVINAVVSQRNIDSCTLTSGKLGICKSIRHCPEAIEGIQQGLYPEVCWWHRRTPVVCCPAVEDLKLTGQKSEKKCAEFHTLKPAGYILEERNLIKPAIIGGVDSLVREFPHMAALGYGEKIAINWQCGGSLISEQFVLTAGHCLNSKEFGDVRWVRLGDLNLKDELDDADPQDYEVKERIKHPDYKPPSQYNDIGLIKLANIVTLTAYVKPACLPVNIDLSYTEPIATGWGRTSFGGEASNVLQKVYLDYFDYPTCKEAFEDIPKRKLSKGIDSESQICAGSYYHVKDTCQGDSGGPLQITNKKYFHTYYIIGVTSFGKACGVANSPGVYTKVSNFVPWIEEIAFS